MIVYRREIRSRFRSWWIWTLSLAAYSFAILMLYPTFADEAAGMDAFISKLPKEFLRAFGLDRLSLSDILGYHATETYIILILASSLYAILIGTSLLSREESDRTIEFLLARPVSRCRIVAEKLLASATLLLALNLVVSLVSWIGIELYRQADYPLGTLLWLSFAPFPAQLVFVHLGLLATQLPGRRKASAASGIGIVLVLYSVGFLAEMSDSLAFLRWLTPFSYAGAVDIVTSGLMRIRDLLVLVGANLLLVAGTFLLYRKKDVLL